MNSITFTHFHFCGGSGGAALGMSRARAAVGSLVAGAKCLGGIDSDPAACRDFQRIVGAPQACFDLFDRDMYRDFHSTEPPPEWREVDVEDVRQAAQGMAPDIIVISAPCKGYSRLLSAKKADTDKYRALNRLVLRCIHLALTAWEDDPPSLFLIENVPAIVTRGRELLDRVASLFHNAGYAARETTHCAGELGGLGQRRRRFLMVARHREKVPALLYEPGRRPLRSIGQVIGEMPHPGSAIGGPMHRLPKLSLLTWLRLALIPAGKDWRALRDLDPRTVGLECYGDHASKLRVEDWQATAHTITGADRVGSGAPSVADRRWGGGPLGVLRLDQIAGTVTGEAMPTTGAFSIADGRWGDYSQYKIMRLSDVSQTITGQAAPGSGPFSVADGRMNNVHRLIGWDDTSPCVTGGSTPSAGGLSVADRRRPADYFGNICRIVRWQEPSGCVTSSTRPTSGCVSVADPRPWQNAGHYGVIGWQQTAPCVTGAASCDNGRNSIADPRGLLAALDGMPLFVADDETWHRPLTILEMAALQGFDWVDAQGDPLLLDGAARARWQERVGNAIPPPSAEAIGGEMLRTLLMSKLGHTFALSSTDVWVRPVALALSVDGSVIEVPA
jgi:site-specific DNA-cytosine methylase